MKSISPEKIVFLALLVLASSLSMPALAADKKDKSARRMQQMVQKIQQEKAELQAQVDQEKQAKTGLEEQVKKTAQETDSLKGSLGAASRKAKTLESDLQSVKKDKVALEARQQETQMQLLATQKSLEELTQKYQVAQQDLKLRESEQKALALNLSQKDQGLGLCEAKNTRLYGFGMELVKLYERPSTYEAILRTEPFTQVKRVELENIFQDYRDKLDEQRTVSAIK